MDPAQAVIFLFMTILAVLAGWMAGASSNAVLLGWFPWATVLSMILAVVRPGGSTVRSTKQSAKEKMALAG